MQCRIGFPSEQIALLISRVLLLVLLSFGQFHSTPDLTDDWRSIFLAIVIQESRAFLR